MQWEELGTCGGIQCSEEWDSEGVGCRPVATSQASQAMA